MLYSLVHGYANAARALLALIFSRHRWTTVHGVYDGDTIYIDRNEPVRLIGIDAPEHEQGSFGAESRERLRHLLPRGSAVRLLIEPRSRDRWGRTLAYVFRGDGLFVNAEMVRQGFALVCVFSGSHPRMAWQIRRAGWSARLLRRGLWRQGGFRVRPGVFRRRRIGWLRRLQRRIRRS